MSYPISRDVYAAALLFAVEPSDRALAGWGGSGTGPFDLARWLVKHAYPADLEPASCDLLTDPARAG